jgi:hypothetical protein
MQEHVGDKLEQVEVAGHKEMQASHVCQVDATHLKHPGGYENQEVDNEQILGNGWYVAEHGTFYNLVIYCLLFPTIAFWPFFGCKITKNICFSVQNEQISNYFT